MAETDATPPPPRPPKSLLLRVLRAPLMVLIALYFILDDVVLGALRPVFAWAAELKIFRRIADLIHALGPYPTLALFAVPFIILEPFKLGALYLLAIGHFRAGTTMLVLSHLASIIIVERLFEVSREKLLTIGWFAVIYGWCIALRDWALNWLKATQAWHVVEAWADALKQRLEQAQRRVVGSSFLIWRRFRPLVADVRIWFSRLKRR